MESNSTAFLIKIKLRHSLGKPSRSDFVQSEFIIIPADELSNISETNIKNALENLEEETFVTLNNMNEERVRCIRESKKPSFTYRKYAFVAQQYINAKIVIEKYYSPIALNMQITETWKENI